MSSSNLPTPDRNDLQHAIEELNTYIDISIDDLQDIYARAQHHAQLRQVESHPLTPYINPEVITISPDESILTAAQRFVDHHISTLPVVDETGRLQGILTEADIMTLVDIPHHEPGTRLHELWEQLFGSGRQESMEQGMVREFMAHHPVTINTNANVGEACDSMRNRRIKTLVVTDDAGMVEGVVSRSTILKALLDTDT